LSKLVDPDRYFLQLQRLGYSKRSGKTFKDDHEVTFGETLKVDADTFSLLGFVCHTASSKDRGHYYSFVKDVPSDMWYRTNDDEVVEEEIQWVFSKKNFSLVHVLVYQNNSAGTF
jgi:ubiquitin C-terminal hydrolase